MRIPDELWDKMTDAIHQGDINAAQDALFDIEIYSFGSRLAQKYYAEYLKTRSKNALANYIEAKKMMHI